MKQSYKFAKKYTNHSPDYQLIGKVEKFTEVMNFALDINKSQLKKNTHNLTHVSICKI